jgi:putative intracellular protease/amidase
VTPKKRVWIPLPDRDFDVTEVAVPWRMLVDAGHEVVFATEHGDVTPAADPLLISGVLFGKLGAAEEPLRFYRDLGKFPAFQTPVAWGSLDVTTFDGVLLPGGHAQGMKQYLGNGPLREKIAAFWRLDRAVGAICHGVLVLARTRTTEGKSIISKRRTTCLPKYMERTAHLMTSWKLGNYYRTYDAFVEDEVRAALVAPESQFERGPRVLTTRGTMTDDSETFVVRDARYVSARWPGDAYAFSRAFLTVLEGG